MNVQILESGKEDLRIGRLFYERQGGRWLGSYFFDTLFSAIDSLAIYAGMAAFVIFVWGMTFANTRALLGDSPAFEILVVRFALAWADSERTQQ